MGLFFVGKICITSYLNVFLYRAWVALAVYLKLAFWIIRRLTSNSILNEHIASYIFVQHGPKVTFTKKNERELTIKWIADVESVYMYAFEFAFYATLWKVRWLFFQFPFISVDKIKSSPERPGRDWIKFWIWVSEQIK